MAQTWDKIIRHAQWVSSLRAKRKYNLHGELTKRAKPFYNRWHTMNQRCRNRNHSQARYYHDRGITVCERWRNYDNWYTDLGHLIQPGLSLDRIDANKHYSCGKCRQCKEEGWSLNVRLATAREQRLNQRKCDLSTASDADIMMEFKRRFS